MKKFIKITLSLVLAVILLATTMPIYAVEDDSIKEVEELREENVKHFEMPDGTFKAIVYSEPVHRKDADGKWQDIDNTLSSEKENGNTNYSSFDGRIKFSKLIISFSITHPIRNIVQFFGNISIEISKFIQYTE
jgi:hypothetical protein